MSIEKIPLLVVTGPTASGKTALAVQLAKQLNGEVISADSMQIYQGMDIATAKPTPEEMASVPHHLISLLPPSHPFSVAEYVSLAHAAAQDIHSRGRLPILAGGTGLYISSMVDNLTFTPEPSDPQLRKQLQALAEQQGGEHLLEMLRGFDPETADTLHPNNLGRIIRSIEVYRLTGRTMSQQRSLSRATPSPYNLCMLGLNFRHRQRLYDRINHRVDVMLEQGLLEEARQAFQSTGPTAGQAIGCKELYPYLQGNAELQPCVEKLKQSTRNYAKRQLTWLRREPRIHWLYPDALPPGESLFAAALLVTQTCFYSKKEEER